MEEGGVDVVVVVDDVDVDGVGVSLGVGALIGRNPQKEKMESLRSFLAQR